MMMMDDDDSSHVSMQSSSDFSTTNTLKTANDTQKPTTACLMERFFAVCVASWARHFLGPICEQYLPGNFVALRFFLSASNAIPRTRIHRTTNLIIVSTWNTNDNPSFTSNFDAYN